MALNKTAIKKILVISLSNIGDIILTFPVIDILRQDFPGAELSVVVGPKGEELLKHNPHFQALHIFDKKQKFIRTVQWLRQLRKTHFDLVVDLRNTAIPFFLSARYKTSPFLKRSPHKHMCWQHLNRLKSIYPYEQQAQQHYSLFVSPEDRKVVMDIITDRIKEHQLFVVIAPGAADRGKRWDEEGFALVADRIKDTYFHKIVFVGDQQDRAIVQNVIKRMKNNALNLAGQLSLTQLAVLLQAARLLITNDSAPLHMASYLNISVLAIFGPSDHRKYGPWSGSCQIVQKKNVCPACQCKRGRVQHACLKAVTPDDVLGAFRLDPDGVHFEYHTQSNS